jgi:hypothetical protein
MFTALSSAAVPHAKRLMSVVIGTNAALIAHVAKLHMPSGAVVADVTYARGMFWTKARGEFTVLASDLVPRPGCAFAADFRRLPYRDASIDVVALDPPYLSKPERSMGYKLATQYNGPMTARGIDHAGLVELYRTGMTEASRVLRHGGQLWIKCKDEIEGRHQRRLHIAAARKLSVPRRTDFLQPRKTGDPPETTR